MGFFCFFLPVKSLFIPFIQERRLSDASKLMQLTLITLKDNTVFCDLHHGQLFYLSVRFHSRLATKLVRQCLHWSKTKVLCHFTFDWSKICSESNRDTKNRKQSVRLPKIRLYNLFPRAQVAKRSVIAGFKTHPTVPQLCSINTNISLQHVKWSHLIVLLIVD